MSFKNSTKCIEEGQVFHKEGQANTNKTFYYLEKRHG